MLRRVILAAWVALASLGCDAPEWRTFDSQDGFTVSFPDEPEVRRTHLSGGSTNVEWAWYVARSPLDLDNEIPSVTFMVGATPKLGALPTDNIANDVKRMVIEGSSNARVVSEEQFSADSCQSTKLELRETDLLTFAEIRVCDDRVFALVAMGPDRALKLLASRFMDSFRSS